MTSRYPVSNQSSEKTKLCSLEGNHRKGADKLVTSRHCREPETVEKGRRGNKEVSGLICCLSFPVPHFPVPFIVESYVVLHNRTFFEAFF